MVNKREELVEKISHKIQDNCEQIKRGLKYMPSEIESPAVIAKYFIDLIEQDNWVSVEDGLPDNAKNVLTARVRSNGLRTVIGIGFYRNNNWSTLCVNADTDITHWQPLPQPPEMK